MTNHNIKEYRTECGASGYIDGTGYAVQAYCGCRFGGCVGDECPFAAACIENNARAVEYVCGWDEADRVMFGQE